jgi:hypothetical protein
VKGVLLSPSDCQVIRGDRHVTISRRPPSDSLGPFINSNVGVTKQESNASYYLSFGGH